MHACIYSYKRCSDIQINDCTIICIQCAPDDHDDTTIHLPLYSKSSITVLQTLAKMFEWFTSHPGTSKEALSGVLKLQSEILPVGNSLPKSYKEAHRIIKPHLLKPQIFHACANDCILYHKQYEKNTECPVCSAPRYKHSGVPVKKFIYLPLGPRITRLFSHKKTAKELQSHLDDLSNADIYDIHDSPVWHKAYSNAGIFKGDRRGISLTFCTDGVNPFNHVRVQYSMWPIMMTLLNLPREKRNLFGNILLLGIIPGYGTKEPKNLDPYLEVVVDEITELSGKNVYDAYQECNFNLQIEIMLYILDYPGLGKVLKVSGSGAYKGCAWCNIKGIASYIAIYALYVRVYIYMLL